MSPTPLVRVWDRPLRIFHWTLLVAVATAIGSGWVGGDWMAVHAQAGLLIIGLLVFRISWGFMGSTHARFVHFVPTPSRLLDHIKGRWQGVGHNPLGALSVLALIGLLGTQAVLGLFSNDDIAFSGPWASQLSEALSGSLTGWHRRVATWVYGLIALHLLAIGFYTLIKKHRLVRPMVSGRKPGAPEQAATGGSRWSLFVSLGLGIGAVWLANGAMRLA